MTIISIFKKIIFKSFFIILLLANASLLAESLIFKVGDKASYNLSHQVEAQFHHNDVSYLIQADAQWNLEVQIISANPTTQSYPFEVEVIFKDFHTSQGGYVNGKGEIETFNIHDEKTPRNTHLITYFNQLINHPLHFKVSENDVQPTTDYLSLLLEALDFEEEDDDALNIVIPGTSLEAVQDFLTHLFHLSTQELREGKSYEVLNPFNDDEKSIYTINQIISNTAEGTYNVQSIDKNLSQSTGKIQWNLQNPLIQQRNLVCEEIDQENSSAFRSYCLTHKTWKATSCD